MILSREIRAEVLEVDAGFFLDRALVSPDSFAAQFIVKAPFEIIGAVHHGANMFLWSGFAGVENQKILAATFTVEDDSDASFYLSRALDPDQAYYLMTFLEERHAHIIFFDELNRALLTLQVSISDSANLDEIKASIDRNIADPNDVQIEAALDDIDARAVRSPHFLKSMHLLRGEGKQLHYFIPNLGFVSPPYGADRFTTQTHLGQEAGPKLEERIAQSLRRRFPPEAILVSPWLPREQRELCDILVGCRWGYLFLEVKAMNVSEAELSRRTERRLAGFRKQAKKALRQLEGVRRRVTGPDLTTVNSGLGILEIETYRHELLHFGIVMSEMHPKAYPFSSGTISIL